MLYSPVDGFIWLIIQPKTTTNKRELSCINLERLVETYQRQFNTVSSSIAFTHYQLIMVFFSSIVVSLLAISTSLASPAIPVERNIAERDLPDFDLTGFNATSFREGLRRRQTANYNQDYTTGGTVDFSGSGSEFSVTWNTQDDFVVGRGWSTGTTA